MQKLINSEVRIKKKIIRKSKGRDDSLEQTQVVVPSVCGK
jgi:hypothetical protein